MPLHLGPRLHAFVGGLFKPSDLAETRAVYERVKRLHTERGFDDPIKRAIALETITADALQYFDLYPDHPQFAVLHRVTEALVSGEGYWHLPAVDWQARREVSDWWALREELEAQVGWFEHYDDIRQQLKLLLINCVGLLYQACPALLQAEEPVSGIAVETDLIRSLGNPAELIEAVLGSAYHVDNIESDLFRRLRERLDYNLIAASGGNPADPTGFNRQPKFPTHVSGQTPEALAQTYLAGTPLLSLFDLVIQFVIPDQTRFEHQHIVAGSGHGKTQTLQYLIAGDIEAMAREQRSVIVLDSQGDLIRTISRLAVFAPGGALHDRIVIIDPTDVEFPVSLNLFDVGLDRLQHYPMLERERLTNSILELYDFVLGTLLDAQMTQKQGVIFRYVTRLMLHIPDATIHTLRELMEPDSHIKFAEHIAKLSGTAKHFFETEFAGKEFEQTKKQVLRRLWGILENQTFERMFSHPRSKLDLFGEMNAGKVILINTAKDLLKETGTEIFGRFFIAMIAQAAQERATLPERERTPTTVYIDEAADYFDRNIAIILSQARKYRVGMVLAHQYLGQLDPKLQEAFAANTAIKLAGGVSAKDARTLAPMLYTDPGFIEAQGKGSFAAYVRGVTNHAVSLRFPFGHMERLPRMSEPERRALQGVMRETYAVHYTDLAGAQDEPEDENKTAEGERSDENEPDLSLDVDATPEL